MEDRSIDAFFRALIEDKNQSKILKLISKYDNEDDIIKSLLEGK